MSKYRSEVFLETCADVILQSDIGNARRPIAGRSGDQAVGAGVACEGRCAGTLSQAGLRGATGKASETVVTEGNTHKGLHGFWMLCTDAVPVIAELRY